ncbi:short chain dehydrogenase/reductase [Leptodontidium sp. 2 PMI_412]|nr:short chain dehydrogenase/reductase [Leptodontidium sp. MPI-SDFR-AT-0119]KAH9221296.1 short chain dehydrogenase/reductase [Leptodontidium sp. 2 PMI_412]
MAPKIVLITGANSGVGYATSKVIASASKDFHVIMAARSLDKANNAKSEIEASGILGQLSAVQLDITDQTSIDKAVAFVEETFGHLDVLVSNAAVAGVGHSDLRSRLQAVMDTNVVGTAVAGAAFRPILLKSPKPYSIYVSSGMGSMTLATDTTFPLHKGMPGGESYRASKSALDMIILQEHYDFSETTALKTFAFCPGFVRSNLRGTSEEAISGGGGAGDPANSGKGILAIIQGERDADVGKFVNSEGGLHGW